MMRKVLSVVIAMVIMSTASLMAGVPISRNDKVTPIDEIWMDMAVTVARVNVEEGGIPCGSVVVFNGKLQSTGQATEKATSVETAIATSRLTTLENAIIYTVNEPTAEAYNAICRAGANAVYFVNPKDAVIAAGVQPADAYDEAKLDESLVQVPMQQMDYDDASELLK